MTPPMRPIPQGKATKAPTSVMLAITTRANDNAGVSHVQTAIIRAPQFRNTGITYTNPRMTIALAIVTYHRRAPPFALIVRNDARRDLFECVRRLRTLH